MKRNSSSSFYDGKNDVTCGKTGGRGKKQQSRPRSHGKCGKTMRERGRAEGRERKRKEEKEGLEGMKAPRIYEGFVFPLKNNVSRNSGYDMRPRGRTSLLFYRCDANALPEIVVRGKAYRVANVTRILKHVDRESRLRRERERERQREGRQDRGSVTKDWEGGGKVGRKE